MKVCFVRNLPDQTGGGAELQCYLIGKGLTSRQWDVAFLTNKPFYEDHVDVQVYYAKPMLQGNGWISRHSRAMSIIRILKAIDPDITVAACAGSLAGFVALYCGLYGKKFVYRAAHVFDADLTFGEGTGWNELGFFARRLHSLAIRRADVIITNAEYVAVAFRRVMPGKSIRVIRNGHEIAPIRNGRPSHVLWIARFEKVKNPMVFVALARELPQIRFVMCGSGPLYNGIAQQASKIQNLRLMGSVGAESKSKLLRHAFVVINTSLAEGFPNTLIEAGLHRTPYISFVDPDEVICRSNLGFHVRSFSELVQKTALIVNDRQMAREIGANIRLYVEREHNIENTTSQYDQALRSILP